MSTTAHQPVEIDTTRPGIGFGRLVAVEWRKMTDTIGGRWLMIVTAALLVVVVAIMLLIVGLNDEFSPTASAFATTMQVVMLLIAPAFCILITTSEWGQRSHLSTFALEPRRGRILSAKLAAVVTFSIAVVALAIGLGALGNVMTALFGRDLVWDVGGTDLLQLVITAVTFNLSAFALGLLLLNSAIAIAVFYVSAIVLRFVVYPFLFVFEWARDLIPFVDLFYGYAVSFGGETLNGDEAGAVHRVAVIVCAIGVWVVLPGVAGWIRAVRSEVK